jgi:O-antigen ligase
VAWDAFESEPLTGTGAGTYELHWMQERPLRMKVRDAHNLYVEALGEIGPVGLALLALLLATPFLVLRGTDRAAFAAPAAGVWAAFVAHAALDWDWEMPAVTVAGLLCGAALLVDPVRVGRAGFRLAPHLLSQRGRPGGRQ